MRKIYSLVLMTAMLFIGANAWAVNVVGNDRAALQTAIDNAATGTTLTLQNDFTLDGPVWLGTENLDDVAKSIILDMNGHNISMSATGSNCYMFVLTHGELLVRNSSTTISQINLTGTTGANNGTQIFSVYGSYKSSRWNADGDSHELAQGKDSINTRTSGWYSHLELGERVKIVGGTNCLGTGIAIDVLHATSPAHAAAKTAKGLASSAATPLTYRTDIFKGNFGVAHGARVDVYGDIEIAGKGESGNYKAYAIKSNGYLDKPHSTRAMNTTYFTSNNYISNYKTRLVDHALDTLDVAFVYVHSTSNLKSDNKSTRSVAVYSSGYSKMLIEGHCEGSVGVYASSGKVEINDAEIVSTAPEYNQPNGGGGVSGSGSAIIVNSRDGYTGEIDVTISGDSKVSSDKGYAIEEVVTTAADTTKVESVTITGGTIEGGDEGAIVVSNATKTDKDAEVVVYGGNVSGDVQAGTSGNLTDLLPTDEGTPTAHVTTVVIDGKTTVVVSEGTAPSGQETVFGNTGAINWKHVDGITTTPMFDSIHPNVAADTTITLTELEINQAYAQTLKVKAGNTLNVGRVVLGENAQIIVEAGAKFVVTGEQGIVAPALDNIVLKATESSHAIFLFNPAVTSNRHPNATVEFVSESYKRVTPTTEYRYQFFCPPMDGGVIESITATASNNNTTYKTQLDVWRVNAWDNIGIMNMDGTGINKAKFNVPFGFYSIISNNPPEVKMTYTVQGALVGNTAPELPIYIGWSTISNAFTGDMNVSKLWDYLRACKDAGSQIQTAVYTYSIVGNTMVWNPNTPIDWSATEIDPMSSIMFKNNGDVEQIALSYNDLIWTPAQSPAPARQLQFNDFTRVKMHVEAENGVYDRLTIAQSSDFTAERDIYEAEQYINDDINFYVTDEDKMAIFATDNLVNTYLGFSCVNGGNFTLTFDNAEGDELYLLDLNTNAIVAMVSGNTYQFTAADGEANDYRFKVVERQEMPTEVETVEENTIQNVGVYTLTGQYLGEMNVWNSLPAGLYIVNGEKKVK